VGEVGELVLSELFSHPVAYQKVQFVQKVLKLNFVIYWNTCK